MVVDTSALFAILAREPEREIFEDIIDATSSAICPAIVYVELNLVAAGRFHRDMRRQVALLFERLRVEIVSVDATLAEQAVLAHLAYGKGFNPARLNICDCFVYALAKAHGEPLLFKGGDFAKTDIVPAWTPEPHP